MYFFLETVECSDKHSGRLLYIIHFVLPNNHCLITVNSEFELVVVASAVAYLMGVSVGIKSKSWSHGRGVASPRGPLPPGGLGDPPFLSPALPSPRKCLYNVLV